MPPVIEKVSRRDFLRSTSLGAGGLLLGFYLPEVAAARPQAAGGLHELNAFVHIGTDDIVTLIIDKAEMGQGTVTSLAMLLAEELEADWTKVRTEFAPVDPAYGASQGVFGSMSIRTGWNRLREAGATAAELLVRAGAEHWGVETAACRAENGTIVNTRTGERLSFGRLAEAAARLPVPRNVAQKDPTQFHLLGTSPRRLDTPAKVRGEITYGIDIQVPGMLHAVLERCPVFGGRLGSFDPARALAVPGVRHVVEVPSGVAVVADHTWAAMQGRKALDIEWDRGAFASASSASLRRMFEALARDPGAIARSEGDADAALGAGRGVEAVYEAPYLAHAPMEPMNCVAAVGAESCEIWAGTQVQTASRAAAARVTGLPEDRIRIHTQHMGGGFGGRSRDDYIAEAVEISKAVGAPVKLTWSREDDMRHDSYRPASYTRFQAALDADGWPTAWTARIVCPSFAGLRNGVDRTAVEGIADIEYAIPNIRVDYHPPDVEVPTWYWRSVGYSQNTFFTESFIDELASAGNKDPVEFRQRLLADAPRMRNVVTRAAELAGWGTPVGAGRGRGIAVVNNIGSFNALVAEVSVENGELSVERMVSVVDCGRIAHPGIIVQQIESGIVYGLGQLKGEITIEGGAVREGNFDQYEVLRIREMPDVEVHVVDSHEAPGGIGEASTPTTVPAVLNAVFAATGKRLRRLPIRAGDLA